MKFPIRLTGRFSLMLILAGSLLAGCSLAPAAAPTPLPTQDPAVLIAAAVQTLGAQMTEQAKLNPTATPVPPTATFTPTITPVPPTATPSLPTNTPLPTATTAPAVSAKALSAGTFPENKREYVPNEKFGLALSFKNTGSVTWEAGYKIKLVGHQGEVTVQPELDLGKRIEPGANAEFDLWGFGSEELGLHIWYFQIYTTQGAAVPGGAISFSYTSK